MPPRVSNVRMTDGGTSKKAPTYYTPKPAVVKPAAKAPAPSGPYVDQKFIDYQNQQQAAAKIRKQLEDQAAAYQRALNAEKARLAAVAEQKRLKAERDAWEAQMHDQDMSFKDNQPQPGKGPGKASAIPPAKPNQSFFDKATDTVENFFQGLGKLPNAIPSQARDALQMAELRGKPTPSLPDYWKTTTSQIEDYFEQLGKQPNAIPTQARDALNVANRSAGKPPSKPADRPDFWNKATTGVEEFFQGLGQMPNAIPSQARDALAMGGQKNSGKVKPKEEADYPSFWNRATTGVEDFFEKLGKMPNAVPSQARDALRLAEDRFSKTNDELPPMPGRGYTVNPKVPTDLAGFPISLYYGPIKGGSVVPLPVAKANKEAADAAALAGEPGDFTKDMRAFGPFKPGDTRFGPLQDPLTGEGKLSYQSRLPEYWEKATPDQLNFYRYAKPHQAAQEAEAAYQKWAEPYRNGLANAEEKFVNDPNAQLAAGLGSMVMGGSITAFNNIKNQSMPTFDASTPFGNRLAQEQAGVETDSYLDTWQAMRTGRVKAGTANAQKNMAYDKVLLGRVQTPDQNDYKRAEMAGYDNVEDYFKYVWDQTNPKSRPGPETKFVGMLDSSGQFISFPLAWYMGDRSMFDQSLNDKFFQGGHQVTLPGGGISNGKGMKNPRPGLPRLMNDPDNKWFDYYIPPNEVGFKMDPGEVGTLPADAYYGDSGAGAGGYGDGSGWPSGGSSYYGPGYTDNQYGEDRYGYFQQLAKWVI